MKGEGVKVISRSDEILMLTILRLKGNAYGVTIVKDVFKRTGKKLTFGSLWISLDILHRRGYVAKTMGDPTPERGGRRKIYYTLTRKGIRAIQEAKEFQRAIWRGIPTVLKKYGQS